MRRFHLPNARRWFGSRTVSLVDGDAEGGHLAHDTDIRGVRVPAGSRVRVEEDFGHIEVTVAAPTVVYGHAAPAGTYLRFLERYFWIPRRSSRAVEVMRPGEWSRTIAYDGRIIDT